MKHAVATLMLLFAACGAFAETQRIAVVKSGSAEPYEAAVAGLRSELSHLDASIKIDEYTIPCQFPPYAQPQVIVAVGTKAVDLMAKTTAVTPIVYMMVMNQTLSQPNITGVTLAISPRQQLKLIKKILPKMRRIGILYDPAQNATLLQQSLETAVDLNIEIVSGKVARLEDIYLAVRELGPRVDALWVIPDSTVYNPNSTKDILLYALRERIPVIGLSSSYVKAGALCSFSGNYNAIGAQAAKMVRKILAGQNPEQLNPEEPETIETSLNLIAADRVDITIPDAIIHGATNVYK
jgi:putative ABC transport system substrate-binding protein